MIITVYPFILAIFTYPLLLANYLNFLSIIFTKFNSASLVTCYRLHTLNGKMWCSGVTSDSGMWECTAAVKLIIAGSLFTVTVNLLKISITPVGYFPS